MSKAICIRLDRIGDLVLTLPVDSALRQKDYTIDWWIPEGLEFVVRAMSDERSHLAINKKFQFRQFWMLFKRLRSERYDEAVIFHAPWWIYFLLWFARVPKRVGPKSRWYSFFFLNKGVRQKRSEAKLSELEYNLQLAEEGLKLAANSLSRSPLKLNAKSLPNNLRFRKQPYYVVHPGMGGSAENWPIEYYVSLIRLLRQNHSVVITGTSTDEVYLKDLRKEFSDEDEIYFEIDSLEGPSLLSVLKNARAVVAPSTGVLHLSASLGTPTFGLYSPVRVQSPTRWGAHGARVVNYNPQVNCPGTFACLKDRCSQFNCMFLVRPERVYEDIIGK